MPAGSITLLNATRIPSTGCLVIPSRFHPELLAEMERMFTGRKITWLIEEKTSFDASTQSLLEKSSSGAMFSAHDANPAAAGKELSAAIQNGNVLIYVPAKIAIRKASACHIPSPHLKVLCAFALPILPIAIDLPRESHLRIEKSSALPIATYSIAHLIPASESSPAAYHEKLLEAYEEAYSERKFLRSSLAIALLQGLKLHGRSNRILDGSDDVELPYDRVLAAAIALSRYLREETDKPRIAIVLPPGKGGLIANLAVIFAGKIPVNLNFTAGHEAIRSCIRQADVDRFITADPFVRKISSFPWPPNRDLILIERVLPTLKKDMIKWAIISKFLPATWLAKLLGADKKRDHDEAILLFTSGSSGEPKGVALSHRNVLANVCQFGTRLDLKRPASILGCLPLFHSFGCTVTLWFPIIEGIDLVTYPSPLETKRLAELIAIHQVHVLLATPTFLRGYMKRIDPTQLSSLKLVVTGAEKLPANLTSAFEEKFGIIPQQGYGLTETSPATNVNLPDPIVSKGEPMIPCSRVGSVGQMLPGIAIRITDPVTDAAVPVNQQGLIWLKGANVFQGYLHQPQKTAEVLTKDGWFRTGDVGRLDEDGFLYIEGRLSRFSKIAGEMVPHESVEAAINKVLGLDQESERCIAVVGVPDEQKGEAILLLSTVAGPALEQECIDLRYKLLDEGCSALWCPRAIIPVAEIPVLASGKLDIKGCESLAKRG